MHMNESCHTLKGVMSHTHRTLRAATRTANSTLCKRVRKSRRAYSVATHVSLYIHGSFAERDTHLSSTQGLYAERDIQTSLYRCGSCSERDPLQPLGIGLICGQTPAKLEASCTNTCTLARCAQTHSNFV